VQSGAPCSNFIGSWQFQSNFIKSIWISNPRDYLNFHSKSKLNLNKFLCRKLFLSSNPSITYFIWNFWSKESPPFDQINSNSFEYLWIICKGYYSFRPGKGHWPTLTNPFLPCSHALHHPTHACYYRSAAAATRPRGARTRPLLHASRPRHWVPHLMLWTRSPFLPLSRPL
jgi:hypothetical protein